MQGTQNPVALNAQQRAVLLANSVEMTQQIFSGTFASPTTQAPINIAPRNVGMIKKFIVEITGTANNTDGANASVVSQLGLANLLSNVQFTDLNNNVRVNTNGFHLAALAMAKRRRPAQQTLSTVVADTNQMLQVGENFPVLTYVAPAKGASQAFRAVYEIPLAYSDQDLRGAVYANVVNATMNLALTINPTGMVAAGSDSTFALFGNGAGNLSGLTVTVYQVYLDQIPTASGRPVLPMLDLSTIYELKNTNFNSFTNGQDFPIPYSNFRDFLSTILVLNSTGADAGLKNGSDVNYFALQSANFTNIWKRDPLEIARDSRNEIQVDFPKGVYYFPSRRKPISTTQYGNMELILNPITPSAGAYCLACWEDFAYTNTLTQAGSLAG